MSWRQVGSRWILGRLTLLVLAVVATPQLSAQGNDTPSAAWQFDEARQFDFWLGEWTVTNRFFRDGSGWVEDGTSYAKIYSILDGKGILEYWSGDDVGGRDIRGFSLRYYDQARGEWMLSLNWPGPNSPSFGQLTGQFRHGRGEFISRGTDGQGNPTMTRYSFSDASPTSLRWDDGVSTDGGRTWRGSWIMEFSRTAEQGRWPALGENFHTFQGATRCTSPGAREMDVTLGRWVGTYEGEGGTQEAQLESWEVLDGCGVMHLWDLSDGYKRFTLGSYTPQYNDWLVLSLDNQEDTGFQYQMGGASANGWITTDAAYASFVPGEGGQPLSRIRWTALSETRLELELQESTDGGESWSTVATMSLSPAG